MTSSMLAMAVSLILGLPIFALGEYVRGRGERRRIDRNTSLT